MRARHFAAALVQTAPDHPLSDLRKYRAAINNLKSARSNANTPWGADDIRIARIDAELVDASELYETERERLQSRLLASIPGLELAHIWEIIA